jgi:hypothetical protein
MISALPSKKSIFLAGVRPVCPGARRDRDAGRHMRIGIPDNQAIAVDVDVGQTRRSRAICRDSTLRLVRRSVPRRTLCAQTIHLAALEIRHDPRRELLLAASCCSARSVGCGSTTARSRLRVAHFFAGSCRVWPIRCVRSWRQTPRNHTSSMHLRLEGDGLGTRITTLERTSQRAIGQQRPRDGGRFKSYLGLGPSEARTRMWLHALPHYLHPRFRPLH